MHTPMKNFRIYVQGISQVPKTAKNQYFRRGCFDKATAQMAQYRVMFHFEA